MTKITLECMQKVSEIKVQQTLIDWSTICWNIVHRSRRSTSPPDEALLKPPIQHNFLLQTLNEANLAALEKGVIG